MRSQGKRVLAVSLVLLSCAVFQAGAEEALTWEDCVREAAKNHPDLIAAIEGVNRSKAGKKITASTLYPQITSSVSAATTKTGGSGTADSYAYGVSGSQLVFDGFKTAADVKAASETMKAAGENFRFVSSEVRFRLRSAFVDLLRAQELIRVTKEIAKLRKDNLVLISLRYQSGLEHKGALLTSEANLEEAKFEVSQAIRNHVVVQRQLTKEMGRETFVPVTVKGELDAGGAAQKKPDFEALVKDNPSLQKLIAQENAAAFGVSAAKRNFFPTLTAQAGAGRTGDHWPPGDDGDRWNMGLGLSLPIFEGGLRVAQVAQAQAALNQARAEERSARDGVIVSLEQAWASWQDALETTDVQKKFLAASEERARIAEAQYAIGMISYDNWTIIEDDLVRAKKALLDAQANALLAEAAWVQAKGETLEHEE